MFRDFCVPSPAFSLIFAFNETVLSLLSVLLWWLSYFCPVGLHGRLLTGIPSRLYFCTFSAYSHPAPGTLCALVSPCAWYFSLAMSSSLVTRLVYETHFSVISACLFNRHFKLSQSRILDFYFYFFSFLISENDVLTLAWTAAAAASWPVSCFQ